MPKKEKPAKIVKPDYAKVNHDLLNAFQLGDKCDALGGYIYMKYPYYFTYTILKTAGLQAKKPTFQKVSRDVAEMMQMFVDQLIIRGATKDTSIFHGKVIRPEEAVRLASQTEDMHLVPSERVIPFKETREILFENPNAFALGRCMCRAVGVNTCLPPSEQNVCLFIGEPNVSFLVSQNPYFRRVTPKEALKLLEDCHKAGFVQFAYFEKPAADRLNAICNCCSCCCIGMQMWKSMYPHNDNPFLMPSGFVPEVSDICNGCGECTRFCGFQAISVDEKTQKVVFDMDRCMGCGLCRDNCPVEAIKLRLEPKFGDPLDIEALKREQLPGKSQG